MHTPLLSDLIMCYKIILFNIVQLEVSDFYRQVVIKFTQCVSDKKTAFSPLREKNYALDRKMIGTF